MTRLSTSSSYWSTREPENTDVLYALGLLYLQNNRLDDSEALFRKLSEREYLTDAANYYLGRIAEERRLYDEAGDWYQGVHKGEHYFDAQIRLAMLLARNGEVSEARRHLGTIRAQSEQQGRGHHSGGGRITAPGATL